MQRVDRVDQEHGHVSFILDRADHFQILAASKLVFKLHWLAVARCIQLERAAGRIILITAQVEETSKQLVGQINMRSAHGACATPDRRVNADLRIEQDVCIREGVNIAHTGSKLVQLTIAVFQPGIQRADIAAKDTHHIAEESLTYVFFHQIVPTLGNLRVSAHTAARIAKPPVVTVVSTLGNRIYRWELLDQLLAKFVIQGVPNDQMREWVLYNLLIGDV